MNSNKDQQQQPSPTGVRLHNAPSSAAARFSLSPPAAHSPNHGSLSQHQPWLSEPQLPLTSFESAAFTMTMAIFSFCLTLFTLCALYQGLQNIPVSQQSSTKQMTLRNQTFFCILMPIVIIYYTKLALADYIRALCERGADK